MEITIENKKYQLNVERAKELGVIKEIIPVVTDFNIGDVYAHPTRSGANLLLVAGIIMLIVICF